ncbi:MAG: SnoaL-like domain-containing protein [Saprospiraceae bacterium]
MTTQEVANRLVELCRANKQQQAIEELYHQDIVSVEPEGSPFGTVKGLAAIAEKGKQFEAMVESFNSSSVSDPIVAENFFSCNMISNVNMRGVPVPVDMDEICVYTVNNGKIVKEEFFYTVHPQG